MRRVYGELQEKGMRFKHLFEMVEASDFLTGRDERQWYGCGFDWILRKGNLVKILDGNYTNDRMQRKRSDKTYPSGYEPSFDLPAFEKSTLEVPVFEAE